MRKCATIAARFHLLTILNRSKKNLPGGFSTGHRVSLSRLQNSAYEVLLFYNFDRMVYSLYGLTREEIAMIENSLKEKAGRAEGADEAAVEENQ